MKHRAGARMDEGRGITYLRVRCAISRVTIVMRKVRVEREARTVMVFSRRQASTNSTWYSRWVKMVECTFSGCTRFICRNNEE